jgi:hypothetical protein
VNPADVDAIGLATVNAAWRRRIDAATLAACLSDPARVEGWPDHLATFFSEAPREAIDRFLAAHRLDPAAARAAWSAVRETTGAEDPALEEWLGELAGPPALGARRAGHSPPRPLAGALLSSARMPAARPAALLSIGELTRVFA